MRIRMTGPADVTLDDGGPITDEAAIGALDGAESDDVCSNYFDSEFADLGITGGSVRLAYDADAGEFRVVTEFSSPVELTPEQLGRLARDTEGQWSDGIGEAGFDDLAGRLGVTISLGAPERVEQIEDGKTTGKTGTGLARAAREGDMAALREHLDAGDSTEARLQGYTPLHLAVLYGRAEAALELIARGADVGARDPQGQEPLLLAALSNSTKDADAARIAAALLERGASVHGHRGAAADPNRGELTPLSMAVLRQKTELAALLRNSGAAEPPG